MEWVKWGGEGIEEDRSKGEMGGSRYKSVPNICESKKNVRFAWTRFVAREPIPIHRPLSRRG